MILSEDGSKFVVSTDAASGAGLEYSETGTVLNKFLDRPLFFGKEKKSGRVSGGRYNQVIEFEDATYKCTVPDGFDAFRRDNEGSLYGIAHNVGEPSHTRIYKITQCGKIIGTVDFPPDNIEMVPPPDEPITEGYAIIHEQYGEPVFAPNGDLYTWKRTPEHYSIVKWTWQDDPNGPKGHDCAKKKGEASK